MYLLLSVRSPHREIRNSHLCIKDRLEMSSSRICIRKLFDCDPTTKALHLVCLHTASVRLVFHRSFGVYRYSISFRAHTVRRRIVLSVRGQIESAAPLFRILNCSFHRRSLARARHAMRRFRTLPRRMLALPSANCVRRSPLRMVLLPRQSFLKGSLCAAS